MRLATLPNPSPLATAEVLHSLEPWQRDALFTVRDRYGIDDDAIIRAALTLFLGLVAAAPALVALALGRESRRTPESAEAVSGAGGTG